MNDFYIYIATKIKENKRQMKARIHKFEQNGTYILLDINSGAVHVIDKMIYEIMDTFEGTNDDAVLRALEGKYPQADLKEALEELHELMTAGELFAPDINVPPTFKQTAEMELMEEIMWARKLLEVSLEMGCSI